MKDDQALDGLEIIPWEMLSEITEDQIDWKRCSLIDDKGQLWIDIVLYGRRARH